MKTKPRSKVAIPIYGPKRLCDAMQQIDKCPEAAGADVGERIERKL